MESASLGLRAADLDLEVAGSGYLRVFSFSVRLFLWISIFEFEPQLLVLLWLNFPMH